LKSRAEAKPARAEHTGPLPRSKKRICLRKSVRIDKKILHRRFAWRGGQVGLPRQTSGVFTTKGRKAEKTRREKSSFKKGPTLEGEKELSRNEEPDPTGKEGEAEPEYSNTITAEEERTDVKKRERKNSGCQGFFSTRKTTIG